MSEPSLHTSQIGVEEDGLSELMISFIILFLVSGWISIELDLLQTISASYRTVSAVHISSPMISLPGETGANAYVEVVNGGSVPFSQA